MNSQNIKEDMRSLRTKKLLYEALFRLLDKQPLKDITVNEICAEAMVHRTTLYKYFEGKYDLLEFGVLQLHTKIVKQFQDTSCRDQQIAIWDIAIDHIDAHKHAVQNVISESFTPTLSVLLDRLSDQIAKIAQQELEPLNKDTAKDPMIFQLIGRMYAGGISSLILWWINQGDVIDKSAMKQYIRDMIAVFEKKTFQPRECK